MKCPTDSVHVASYVVVGVNKVQLSPCGHTVGMLISETAEPRAVAAYPGQNFTVPGQTAAGQSVMPSN